MLLLRQLPHLLLRLLVPPHLAFELALKLS